MTRNSIIVFILTLLLFKQVHPQTAKSPDTVTIHSGRLLLKGLLWRPAGTGPFPTIIFCHGSYGGGDTLHHPEQQIALLGPVFSSHGYIYLGIFRRGVGLSEGQGVNSTVLMDDAFSKKGQEGRNEVQLKQLQTDQLQDMMAAVKWLRKRKEVDNNRMAIVGHSFGGSLALLVAEHCPSLKASIVFAAAGYSWNLSPRLRDRLIAAVATLHAPLLIIHAQNDYSTAPGYALDSVMNKLNKPHVLEIYPKSGETFSDGHNFIFQSIATWEADVFEFLNANLRH